MAITKIPRICQTCGQTFSATPTQVRHDRGKYCSRSCLYQELGKNRVERNCEYCGKQLSVPQWQFKSRPLQYCSRACVQAQRIDNLHKKDLGERFFSFVKKTESCWLWTGATSALGYGKLSVDGKLRQATAISYFLQHGTWPELFMCHSCDNPPCVNPDHLFPGDHKANHQDMMKKGRQGKGSSKLTPEQVLAIRQDARPQSAIAKDFGVSKGAVSCIKLGKTWKHIKTPT